MIELITVNNCGEHSLQNIRLPLLDEIMDYGDCNTSKADLLRTAEAYRLVGLLRLRESFPDLSKNKAVYGESASPIAAMGSCNVNTPACEIMDYAASCDPHNWFLVLQTLQLVEAIPISSGTCYMHSFILIFVGTRLYLPKAVGRIYYEGSMTRKSVLQMRNFVELRMLDLSRRYVKKLILWQLDEIKRSWRMLDSRI